jgi:D-xylose transport system substrate-binding protein
VSRRRLWVLLPVVALMLTACGSDDDSDDGEAADGAAGEGLTIGVSWNNFNEPRWAKFDEPAIMDKLEELGAEYIETDAGSSEEQQLADVENLISQGADALIILAQDGTAIKPAVQSAIDEGIPVVGYDRLIEDENAFYLSFDNGKVGELQAEYIYNEVPEGNYVFIKGNQADANADFLREGQERVLLELSGCDGPLTPDNPDADCPIQNVGESYTDNWATEVAQDNMEQFLTQNNNDVDAVVSSNDGMAIGVIAALEAQGLAGEVAVSGQDGDAANLNKVALGEQTVDVWKNAFELGEAAAEIAVAMADGDALEDVSVTSDLGVATPADGNQDAAPFTTPGGIDVWSLILEPTPVTQENLSDPIEAGAVTEEEVCAGVEAGTVEVCG